MECVSLDPLFEQMPFVMEPLLCAPDAGNVREGLSVGL